MLFHVLQASLAELQKYWAETGTVSRSLLNLGRQDPLPRSVAVFTKASKISKPLRKGMDQFMTPQIFFVVNGMPRVAAIN